MSKEVAKIMEILESKSFEVDNHNNAVFESDFEDVAIQISDICFLPVVSETEKHECKFYVNANWTKLKCECGKEIIPSVR